MTTVKSLQTDALNYWPEEIFNKEKEVSVLPRLIETQEYFISLLHVSDRCPNSWIDSIQNTTFSPNVFLKHLVVLSDIGGEPLNRLKNTLREQAVHKFTFSWKGEQYFYEFKTVKNSAPWNNVSLNIDGKSVFSTKKLTDAIEVAPLFGQETAVP